MDNEKEIQDSLNQLIKNKTVLIISHRLKSIHQVDRIVLIDNGRVDNIGSHESLKKHSALYRNLLEKTNLAETFKY